MSAALSDTDLSRTIRYRTFSKPGNIEQVLASALDHFFNHQTHHRGQAHALLTSMIGNERTPSFDLIIYSGKQRKAACASSADFPDHCT